MSKRYDVYCTERGQRIVVYRNALFKAQRKLFSSGEKFDLMPRLIELEQSNGQTVFLSWHCVTKFCEHGVELTSEVVAEGG